LTDSLRDNPAQRVAATAGGEGKDDLGQWAGFAEGMACFRRQRQAGTSCNEIPTVHFQSLIDFIQPGRLRRPLK
jgi:hypothetical protein